MAKKSEKADVKDVKAKSSEPAIVKQPKAKKERIKPHKGVKKVEYEKVFTVPLRRAFDKTRQRRAPCAIRIIKEFLGIHLKSDDIRIGSKLNEKIWERSIQKPPRRVRVGVRKSGTAWLAELEGFEYIEFKPTEAKKSEGMAEKLASRIGGKAMKNQEEEKLADGKEEDNRKMQMEESKSSSKTENKQPSKDNF